MDTDTVLKQIEDHLFPALKLSVRERSLYYHLLRHTRLLGKDSALFAVAPLANSLNVAESSARQDIRALDAKGCIQIERSRRGHLVRVLLPAEVDGIVPVEEPALPIDLESIDFFKSREYVGALVKREDGRCFYCLRKVDEEHCELDHAVPQMHGVDNSYRNIVASCHECNTTKQGEDASDFLRSLYRSGLLSQSELEQRLSALDDLRNGKLVPDM